MPETAIGSMAVVGLYILVTAPLLYLLLRVHAMKSDYTRLFVAALLLQIIPIGLFFFPFGVAGVLLLAVSLGDAYRRHARLKAMGIDNPEVSSRWQLAYMLHLWAIGFTLEQKGVAYLFLDVVNHRGFGFFWQGFLPMSAAIWLILGALILREWRTRRLLQAG